MGYCNDIAWGILNDPTRNSGYGSTEDADFCDQSNGNSNQSPDWSGPGWYKIEGLAGNMLPEYPVDTHHCGTTVTGWLNGFHPVNVGQTVNRLVCFNANGNECYLQSLISIKNCGGFYLYDLGDTPGCNLRYCAE